jgi:hypothetical protein
MVVINQDRDQIHNFTNQNLLTAPAYSKNGILIGFNLFLGSNLLGTFDTVADSLLEIDSIVSCEHPEYYVSGYFPFGGETFD